MTNQQAKPNILLITTDTQRCDTLRCMGNIHAISPNLDKLASEGVMFMQAHTASPVCMPARCSLLTGLHTPIHGCIENGIERRNDLPLFPDFLKEKGYKNIMVGKTHFGQIPDSFDVQHIILGEKDSKRIDPYTSFIRAHGYERQSKHPNNIPEELCMEAFLVDTLIDEIKQVKEKKEGPFFAFCSLLSPHAPVDPPGRWAKLYDGVPLPEINYVEGEVENQPIHLRRLVGTLNTKTSEEINDSQNFAEGNSKVYTEADKENVDELRRLYYGLASYCDHQIGRLIQFLDEEGLREDTLVIFTSDHGQQYCDHGFNDKHNYYDSSWRVPLIISMPGTLPSNEKRDFAIWTDITATILAAAGTGCASIQGFDLYNPLKEGKASPRECAVGTLYKSAALTTGKWKLEYYFEEGKGRLFDLENDPVEQKDVYLVKEYKDIANALTTALLAWRADISDVDLLTKNSKGKGGPVAQRITPHTHAMTGKDAELRLNKAIKPYK